jgi:type 2 lantibiotic biosynthesis protein LanM
MTPPPLELDADCLGMAQALAEQIWKERVHTRDGGVTWLKPEPAEAPASGSINPYLYDGTAGIALFHAAFAFVTGNPEYRERSLLTLAPIRRRFAEIVADPERAAALERVGIGGCFGLGSLVYSYVRIGHLLEEPELVTEAADLSRLFTPERISNDSIRDFLLGSAGAVCALLALYRALEEGREAERVLEIACDCARNLLAGRILSEDGAPVWPTLPGFPPLTGLSHGAAGLCAALLRLHEQTREPQLWEAAQECLAFERRTFHPEHGNWRDTRDPHKLHFATTWCYGAPGIALGRLGTLSVLDDPQVRAEIRSAVETTRSLPLTPLDHLCCGNMGRTEVLLYAGSKLGDEELPALARQLAAEVLDRQKTVGGFRWRLDQRPGFFDPTFFTGAAGIGYALLRLAAPRRLPCVLILE